MREMAERRTYNMTMIRIVSFQDIKNVNFWWSVTESSGSSAYYRGVFWDGSDESRDFSSKKDGFSVRCVKD